jgi:hypothetical protein
LVCFWAEPTAGSSATFAVVQRAAALVVDWAVQWGDFLAEQMVVWWEFGLVDQ